MRATEHSQQYLQPCVRALATKGRQTIWHDSRHIEAVRNACARAVSPYCRYCRSVAVATVLSLSLGRRAHHSVLHRISPPGKSKYCIPIGHQRP
eukprot:7164797-Pyramimonas_sp.AAC.1